VSTLLIQNANVLTIAPDAPVAQVLYAHDVLIRGNRIEAIQHTGQADPSQFDSVIRANGQLLMPGLINTHAHVPMVLFRGLAEDVSIDRWFNDYIWALEANLSADAVYWGAQLGLAEMIRGGVTTVSDHYFHMPRVVEAVEQAGTRAVLAWAVFGSLGLDGVETTARFAAEYQGAAGGRITTMLGPHATYTCDDDFLIATAKAAKRVGAKVHIHAAETLDQTHASLAKRGETPIQVLEKVGILDAGALVAHVCGALPQDVELLARYDASVAYAIKTHLKLSMGYTPLQALRAAGVAVGLATDGTASNNTLDIWEALRLMAMIQKANSNPEVMPIAEALYVATRESARSLGLGDRIGAVEVGYIADLILVDMGGLHHQPVHDPLANLVYNTLSSDVQTVIVDGRVVMRDSVLLTLDEARIVHEIGALAPQMRQRLPGRSIQNYQP